MALLGKMLMEIKLRFISHLPVSSLLAPKIRTIQSRVIELERTKRASATQVENVPDGELTPPLMCPHQCFRRHLCT